MRSLIWVRIETHLLTEFWAIVASASDLECLLFSGCFFHKFQHAALPPCPQ